MSDTPSTAEVRSAYVMDGGYPTDRNENAAEFDRWLAAVRAEAWEDGYAVGANPHRDRPVPYDGRPDQEQVEEAEDYARHLAEGMS